jgi:hypothetical protein
MVYDCFTNINPRYTKYTMASKKDAPHLDPERTHWTQVELPGTVAMAIEISEEARVQRQVGCTRGNLSWKFTEELRFNHCWMFFFRMSFIDISFIIICPYVV